MCACVWILVGARKEARKRARNEGATYAGRGRQDACMPLVCLCRTELMLFLRRPTRMLSILDKNF